MGGRSSGTPTPRKALVVSKPPTTVQPLGSLCGFSSCHQTRHAPAWPARGLITVPPGGRGSHCPGFPTKPPPQPCRGLHPPKARRARPGPPHTAGLLCSQGSRHPRRIRRLTVWLVETSRHTDAPARAVLGRAGGGDREANGGTQTSAQRSGASPRHPPEAGLPTRPPPRGVSCPQVQPGPRTGGHITHPLGPAGCPRLKVEGQR